VGEIERVQAVGGACPVGDHDAERDEAEKAVAGFDARSHRIAAAKRLKAKALAEFRKLPPVGVGPRLRKARQWKSKAKETI